MIPTPRHFGWAVDGRVGTITLDRPERKNPLTFESYAELTATFRALARDKDVRATGKSEAGARAHLARHSTTGTFVTMREVAEAVVSLCSVEASATTGQTIVVAGGEALS